MAGQLPYSLWRVHPSGEMAGVGGEVGSDASLCVRTIPCVLPSALRLVGDGETFRNSWTLGSEGNAWGSGESKTQKGECPGAEERFLRHCGTPLGLGSRHSSSKISPAYRAESQHDIVIQTLDFGAKCPGFKSCLFHLLAVWPWAGCLTSPYLSFLYKRGQW